MENGAFCSHSLKSKTSSCGEDLLLCVNNRIIHPINSDTYPGARFSWASSQTGSESVACAGQRCRRSIGSPQWHPERSRCTWKRHWLANAPHSTQSWWSAADVRRRTAAELPGCNRPIYLSSLVHRALQQAEILGCRLAPLGFGLDVLSVDWIAW